MKPHECPICKGKGIVPKGFYDPHPAYSDVPTATEPCKACNGQGILWGLDTPSQPDYVPWINPTDQFPEITSPFGRCNITWSIDDIPPNQCDGTIAMNRSVA